MRRIVLFILASIIILLLAGCSSEQPTPPSPAISMSMPVFRYDAARDVVVASTMTLTASPPVTAQVYADSLAAQPAVSYLAGNIHFADPKATVTDGVLTVNYQDTAGLDQLSSAQSTAVMAALEAWWWVPGVTAVRLLAKGQPVTRLGPLAINQPLQHAYHTYVIQAETGEVAYLVGGLNPTSVADAVTLLQRRAISDFPATQGFTPLLPPNTTISAATDAINNGILPVNLSANFPLSNSLRLAGIVLMLTQFPSVQSVQFTVNDKTVDQPFMRSNLNRPILPQDLLLPALVSVTVTGDAGEMLQKAASDALGRVPAAISQPRTWQDWAVVTLVPEIDAAPQQVILQKTGNKYTLFAIDKPTGQLLRDGMPIEAIIACRLTGWEPLVIAKEMLAEGGADKAPEFKY